MDIQPKSDQSISDDQELAKVLAGVSAQADAPTADDQTATTATDTTPVETPATEEPAAPVEEAAAPELPEVPAVETPTETPAVPDYSAPAPAVSGDLESIKKEALGELRPLVDKLNVAPDEKFDTYLLLLRSTDDSTLIGPAHDAAKNIPDETRRAQALLDVIKEIDFLSNPGQAQQ